MNIHERVARALGWSVAEARSFSLIALRDLVRPVSPKLVHEIDFVLRGAIFLPPAW